MVIALGVEDSLVEGVGQDVPELAPSRVQREGLVEQRDRLRAAGFSIAIDSSNVLLATTAGDGAPAAAEIHDALARVQIAGVAFRVRTRRGRPSELLEIDAW
jgi:hypothetical protein